MSTNSSLKNIQSVENLIDYLKEKGIRHQSYYHYTTWDSFEKIYTNCSFLLTRGNSLSINDQHEALTKGSTEEWDKTYIGSFSFGAAENMAMWGLYGLPWENAVRIEIPRIAMKEWINSIDDVIPWSTHDATSVEADVHIADIIYVNGKTNDDKIQLTHRDMTVWVTPDSGLRGLSKNPLMTGYIKNYAWHYENEVRLIARLPDSIGNEKVKLSIPVSVIEKMHVVTGPSFQHKNCQLYQELKSKNRLVESEFFGLVKYRPLCSMCGHDGFTRRSE